MKKKTFLHALACFVLLSSNLQASSLWPAGEGICLGEWSYEEALICDVPNGNFVYSETPRYPLIFAECRAWEFGEELQLSETRQVALSYRTGVENEAEARDWCSGQSRILEPQRGEDAWKDGSFQPDLVKKKRVGRNLRIEAGIAICQLDEVIPKMGRGAICGTIQDTANPIYDIIGRQTDRKADISCGIEAKTLPRGSNRNDIMNLPTVIADSFECSTGDNLPSGTETEAKAKAAIINKQVLAALRLDKPECDYKVKLANYALDFVTEHGSKLVASQAKLLGIVAKNTLNSCQ